MVKLLVFSDLHVEFASACSSAHVRAALLDGLLRDVREFLRLHDRRLAKRGRCMSVHWEGRQFTHDK
jgi:hypothetical protein